MGDLRASFANTAHRLVSLSPWLILADRKEHDRRYLPAITNPIKVLSFLKKLADFKYDSVLENVEKIKKIQESVQKI